MIFFFIGGIVLLGVVLIMIYNSLVGSRQQSINAWSQIEVQLKRRHDLIGNLVETVKGAMAYEKETLEKIIQARQRAVGARSQKQQIDAENQLTSALNSFYAVSEAYPDLKANENMAQLQGELTNTEDKIALSREFYNDTTTNYNTKTQTMPSNLLASMFNFKARELFEIYSEAEREPVKVSFT